MQISPKPKTFSEFFIASIKSTLNSEYFEKKDQSHSLSITEIIDCETGSFGSQKCLKGHLSCNASAVNMVTAPKHCSDLQGTTFILQVERVEKGWS